ncbi:4Fe-4S dicluster domain-containing protein [Dethiobacter alkaliphilus]|uniref:4Fe-4S dicluster domain-containing protein n=1 Tax=Dethiobacter alkaliphilus TaxID=427926 RepID=UPI00222795D5|nr:4Fe-4S dicluster domain-containing protein [Dethiobacter alkaliphilus]MCW3491262.1 4Fe-4S binding protein [Dethiobacter alkaliphilus]
MTVQIDGTVCDGCPHAKEAPCMRVCPGDLLTKNSNGKAAIAIPEDCWDCAACVKECPRGAISLFLPTEAGGRGSTLVGRKKTDGVQWTLTDRKGKTTRIFTAGKKVI